MATQGLVSGVQRRRVLFKIVAGCNGYNAKAVSERIAQEWKRKGRLGSRALERIAIEEEFGCDDCRVILTQSRVRVTVRAKDEATELYFPTFGNPRFNPRWRSGKVANLEILDLS